MRGEGVRVRVSQRVKGTDIPTPTLTLHTCKSFQTLLITICNFCTYLNNSFAQQLEIPLEVLMCYIFIIFICTFTGYLNPILLSLADYIGLPHSSLLSRGVCPKGLKKFAKFGHLWTGLLFQEGEGDCKKKRVLYFERKSSD